MEPKYYKVSWKGKSHIVDTRNTPLSMFKITSENIKILQWNSFGEEYIWCRTTYRNLASLRRHPDLEDILEVTCSDVEDFIQMGDVFKELVGSRDKHAWFSSIERAWI